MKKLVKIRRDFNGLAIKPECEQLDGKIYNFYEGWQIDSGCYKGEYAMVASDDTYPRGSPLWIASGDLVDV